MIGPATLLACATLGAAQETGGGAPSWTADVRPILAEHCFECHGPDPATRAAGLRLDAEEGLFGAEGGPIALVRGDAAESELLYRATSEDEFDRMPPPEHGERLDAADIATLRSWIESGAPWEAHWAYAELAPIETPEVRPGRDDRGPIDAFVHERLEREGLAPSPPADPAALIRRLHLDLTGLPPTQEELEGFLAAPDDGAYADRVDALLASTAYGEHWARHWLDVARYADSHGFTIDGGRSIWPWRDWVVDAIARDLPFDAFTIEQLAGDLLPEATRAQRIATGFHRNTQVNQEGGAKDEENRVNAVIDRVATTGAAWLGSTIGCAQCHTHKFDPVTQTEYFGLYAFFNGTTDAGVSGGPSMLVPRDEDEERRAAEWEAELERLLAAYRAAWDVASVGAHTWQPARATGSNGPELRPEEDGSYRVVGQNPVYSTYVLQGSAPVERVARIQLEVLPDGGPGRAGNRNFVLQEIRVARRAAGTDTWEPAPLFSAGADFEQDTSAEGGAAYAVAGALPHVDGPGWAVKPAFGVPHVAQFELAEPLELAEGDELRIELQQEHGGNHTLGAFRVRLWDFRRGAPYELVPEGWVDAWRALAAHRGKRPKLPSTLVLQERGTPRVTRLFHRGSFLDPREVVPPGVPAAWDGFREEEATMRTRLDLARWLVDPENALVLRVTVNRWWQQIFGTGLVRTENDFGLRGAEPSHPELLDWLAAELVRGGFSRRHVLREIVLSSTYRRSASAPPDALERDPENVLLGRRRRARLTGEQLRDSMLAAAGVLDRAVGGPPVQPPQPDGVYAFTQNRKSWKASEGTARFRRSLYTRIWRSAPFPFYATFDAPAANQTCTRRIPSRTALQALALANDPMVMELAEEFGRRVCRELPADDARRARAAFRWTLGRSPSAAERDRLLEHVERVRAERGDEAAWAAAGRVLFNLGEFTHRP
ncbi:MAG: PSD1 and planctomycete cytochrome C domain-containing protein [Planctomycetota bacterium]